MADHKLLAVQLLAQLSKGTDYSAARNLASAITNEVPPKFVRELETLGSLTLPHMPTELNRAEAFCLALRDGKSPQEAYKHASIAGVDLTYPDVVHMAGDWDTPMGYDSLGG